MRSPHLLLTSTEKWMLFSHLCIFNYSDSTSEALVDADTCLWWFLVERRDSSGCGSPNSTNQEENDQICLYHIWKSCSFQGKSEESPSFTCRWSSWFLFKEFCLKATPQGRLLYPQRVGAFFIVSWCGTSAKPVRKRFCWGVEDGRNWVFGNQTVDKFWGT